jgi:hypothetical protein
LRMVVEGEIHEYSLWSVVAAGEPIRNWPLLEPLCFRTPSFH